MTENTAKERYMVLERRRDPFLRRARRYAELTIPSLLPPEGHNSTQDLPDTYQGFSARLVTNLASQMMAAFLPPGQNFFILTIPPEVLMAEGQQETPAELQKGLALSEKTIHREVNRKKWRQPTYMALQHLIVTGNALEKMTPDNKIRVFRLDQYCVVRDPSDNLIEVLVKEVYTKDSLPEELASHVPSDKGDTEDVEVYTWAKWDNKLQVWLIHQEVEDAKVADSEGEFEVSPFNALRWTAVPGEAYGRAKAEDHIGDLKALEGFAKHAIDGSAMASRNITLIRPNSAGGLNLRRRLSKAKNGDYVVGNPDDVEMKQFENVTGIQLTKDSLAELKQELGQAFLMNSAARRDAERVTATEIRMMVEEIEGVLGGVFTTLAGEFQDNRLERLILQMQRQGKLPEWPREAVEPTVLTGIEALGRERDVERVSTALQFIGQVPEEAQDYPKWEVLLTKLFNGLSLPDAVHDADEVQEMRQRRAEQEMSAQAGMRAAVQQAQQQQNS